MASTGRENQQALPYDLFAPVYDHFFGPDAARDTERALEVLLFRNLPLGATVLDLCSGTGQLSRVLLDRGYQVTGIDNSAAMLQRARENAPGARFQVVDARDFRCAQSYDAVISAYNSLVHLTNLQELGDVFRNVYEGLKTKGIFIFDLYNEAAYQQRWRGSFAKVDRQYACIVHPSYDPKTRTGENLATIFYEANGWHRTDVRLVSHCFTESELREGLGRAGFAEIQSVEAASGLGIESAAGRVFWRAAKS